MKRLLLSLRLVQLAVVILAVGACAKRDAKPVAGTQLQPVRFLTDWHPQAEHGGFYQALAQGFYREAGLEVDLIPGGPGPRVPQKLMGGAGDLAMGRSDDVIVWASTGLPFVIVGAFMQHDPQGILLHQEDPAHTFAQLDGRTIMAIPGSSWIPYLKFHYDIDFNLIPMNFGLAQFMADPTFIQQCFVTNEPYYVRTNGGQPKTLLIADSGYDPYRVIFTTKTFAQEHPDIVRAFVAASTRGWQDFMHRDPTPAKTLIQERNPQMAPEFIDYGIATMAKMHLIDGNPSAGERPGQLSRARLQSQIDLLISLKLIPASMTVDAIAPDAD